MQPEFSGDLVWYDRYIARHGSDGKEGRLVSMHDFSESWSMREMHPQGGEVVVCIAGQMSLHQENADGTTNIAHLYPGQYAINDRGVWHTVDVKEPGSALFITSELGTEHRER